MTIKLCDLISQLQDIADEVGGDIIVGVRNIEHPSYQTASVVELRVSQRYHNEWWMNDEPELGDSFVVIE